MSIDRIETQEEKDALDRVGILGRISERKFTQYDLDVSVAIAKIPLKKQLKQTQDELRKLHAKSETTAKEWDGEDLPPIGVECWFNWNQRQPQKCTPAFFGDRTVVYLDEQGEEFATLIEYVEFGKILTIEEIEMQGRMEAAYDLYCLYASIHAVSFNEFCRIEVNKWLAVVEKTGYRKESK